MTEFTVLLAQFSNLVCEQQMEITTIHETTVQSKKNVEKGHDLLVDAAERTKKSRHYMLHGDRRGIHGIRVAIL